MKTIYTFLVIFFLFNCTLSVHAQYETIMVDGLERTYLLDLPTGYDATTELPLLIAMHGGLGSAYNLQNQSQLSEKAEEENFIVVYPEGVESGFLNIRTWNAGWCCGNASDENIDDVGFIDSLIEYLLENYSINSKRVYATGMSNGGYMSYRLACELSDKIAAIAPVSAAMSMTSCDPERPVPIIHFHSYLDENVLYDGGIGDGLAGHYSPPLDSILNVWAGFNNCTNSEILVDNNEYTYTKWNSCDCAYEIQYYITQDGGHSWHGGNGTASGDPASNYISANDLMWEFFQKHTLDCGLSTNINDEINNTPDIKIYPNPSNGKFHIQHSENFSYLSITVNNVLGETVLKTKNESTIDLSNHLPGIYFITTQTDIKTLVQKVILN